jgi:hypothetical protein
MMLGRRMPRVERYHGERRSQRLQREACLDHRARGRVDRRGMPALAAEYA